MANASDRQGGDIESHIELDLSTCVNPYGPSPAVIEALRNADPELIKRHPYQAANHLKTIYAQRLGVDEASLVATRGASEAIWHLAKIYKKHRVALPLPTYTEYLRAFVNAETFPAHATSHTIEQLDYVANISDVVVFSNPHNPSGHIEKRDELLELFDRHQQCTFIVDESYADFVSPEDNQSIVGSHASNVVVLRSPTKFFGLGGVRVGVVHSLSHSINNSLTQLSTTWPISQLDVELVRAAFEDSAWEENTRTQLIDDGIWLDGWLAQFSNVEVTRSPLHFRLVTGEVELLQTTFDKHAIAVRSFDERRGFDGDALRITAPSINQRVLLESAQRV